MQWYIYLPLIIIEVALIVKNIEKPKTNYMDILIPTVIILGIALLFLSYKMTTTITRNYIIIKMSWFGTKKFSLETIKYYNFREV